MLNLIVMKKLHVILKDITIFLCVALPIVYCVSLLFLIYALNNNIMLVSYYAVKLIAGISVLAGLCIMVTIGLGLHLSKRS